MKRYRTPREVLAEVEKLAAARPSMTAPLAVLDQTAELLHRARNYSWVGISLHAGEQSFRQVCRGSEPDPGLPQARSKFMAPIRIVGRELGVIELESEREYAFGRQERVLLERVASRLGRYIVTRGKHVLFRLREQAQSAADAAAAAVLGPSAAIRPDQPSAKK
ncbi:MAG: hypothetical protein ACRD3R_09885, partial [Terriglobales bacterium]